MTDDPKRQADKIIDALERKGLIDSILREHVRQTIVQVLSPEQPTFEALGLAVADGPEDWPPDYQQQFWDAYPRKIGRTDADRRLGQIRKSGKVRFGDIIAAVEVYRHETRSSEMKYIAHPATWLNKGRWKDDPAAISGAQANGRGEVKNGFMGRLMD